jgi:FkbM family methyltransferase
MQQNNGKQYHIGSNRWFLKETKGARIFDKFVLTFLKVAYMLIFVSSKILHLLLNKEGNDSVYKRISFAGFLYKSIEYLKLDNFLLIVFNVPKYDYRFYSRVTRKIENFLITDMYISMTAHEEDILENFSPMIGDTVIDVGAAFGFYTIISSKRVGLEGKVIAIEAQPDIYEMLNKNIELNQLTNVTTLNFAAYSKESKLKIYSNYSVMTERANNKEKFVEVNANTLDTIIQKTGIKEDGINWIKIDVEGAEYEVLRGATSILSQSKDIALLVEIHNLGEGKNMYEPIVHFLNEYSFKIDFEKTYESGEKHVIFRKNMH